MAQLPPVPERANFVDNRGVLTQPHAGGFLRALRDRAGGTREDASVDSFRAFQTTVGQAALASAGTVTIINARDRRQWRIREIILSGDGTNFSGGGGDRLLDVTDGTSVYTSIPAATLQSLAAARWGDTGVPFPATASHLLAATAVNTALVAQYSGGATDYTAGSLTLVVIAERVV